MYRLALLSLLAFPALAPAQPTHQVKLNGHTFTLPQGFTIEVAAGADLAPRPIAAAFDDKGRLYVTDSSGSNENVKAQVVKKPHRILRLESTKGDGRFDKQTVFVKNVMFPEGCMFLNGSLYVAAPPHIWKFTDTDGDGVADKEEIWFDGKTLTGCANDLHGPYPGPDGWIYWCKGAFAKQEHTVNGKKFVTRAAHVFRARPDGTGIEPVMTGGMDNPVDVVFTPTGDLIFSTTFFQHPGGGKRDGLIHAIYGGVYGKDHDVVHEHPWTGPHLMPVLAHLGPAAPSGLHRYESDQFGKGYENNLFCCQFNLRKVSRHVLVPKGSSYETTDSDFLVSDNLDFHPTDVIEDADGSLLVVDTGGWYKLCCPTSQLVKPDVTGAIYRIRKAGAHRVADPRGAKIDWGKLGAAGVARLLDDPRPCVRKRAAEFAATHDPDDFGPFDVLVCAVAGRASSTR
jgi:putative membrane-bound dehydrogenase-like protein